MDQQVANRIKSSICNGNRISGYSHDFYKYPARFPPSFARQIIEVFTEKNDLVIDPYMGGGTTLVEANVLGRRAVGIDISSLATFISRVKTYLFSEKELGEISQWLYAIQPKLNIHLKVDRPSIWIKEGYQRNINGRYIWRVRKTIELMLNEISNLSNPKYQDFCRCLLLRTAQWAIDCRSEIPSVSKFRNRSLQFLSEFSIGALQFAEAVKNNEKHFLENESRRIQCVNSSSDKINNLIHEPPKLILTSPPYPGVHVLYHRWQVHGRKETPSPFWIAGCKDGHGESFYTMGGRTDYGISKYFTDIERSFRTIYNLSDKNTFIVQVIAFSEPDKQFDRYLNIMKRIGFLEERFPKLSNSEDGRLWRSVPNRKWYTAKKDLLTSSNEVVLFHRKH